MSKKRPNIVFFGIDSLRSDHMSLYGYKRLTTPHIDKYAQGGVVFEHCFSPHIPTTSGYSSMLTGMDCFGTNVVALRHVGGIAEGVRTLPEILKDYGYNTTCIGFRGNAASRGFDTYIDFEGWGASDDGRAHKAENLNAVALPELERLHKEGKPFMLFMRHMDPHSPYLPPEPFHKMLYQGDEFDKNNKSLEKVYEFKPFRDYFYSWFPPYCTDAEYIIAQYDAAIAYMDVCIQSILTKLEALGIEDETLVIFTSDHGETLMEHDCYFDHHGLYDCTLNVPLIIKYKGLPKGMRIKDYCQLKDIVPTLLDILDVEYDKDVLQGSSLVPLVRGEYREPEPEFYITECTWMRKHGWRTPEWKLIVALEPDFHFKPEIELYNLVKDPGENHNVASENPEVVEMLKKRMEKHILRRTSQTGRENPMYTNLNWHGYGEGAFKSSKDAYDTLHIGDPEAAKRLQQKEGNK